MAVMVMYWGSDRGKTVGSILPGRQPATTSSKPAINRMIRGHNGLKIINGAVPVRIAFTGRPVTYTDEKPFLPERK